jgi:hypothetical protein
MTGVGFPPQAVINAAVNASAVIRTQRKHDMREIIFIKGVASRREFRISVESVT